MTRKEKINRIVEGLYAVEKSLSDGYSYYLPGIHLAGEDYEEKAKKAIREVAAIILDKLEGTEAE